MNLPFMVYPYDREKTEPKGRVVREFTTLDKATGFADAVAFKNDRPMCVVMGGVVKYKVEPGPRALRNLLRF